MEQAKSENANDDELLALAQQLVAKLRSGDESGASEVVSAITRAHENSLFRQVGKLTRQLHESLNNFSLEPRVALLTDKKIPDARGRLNHVIALTQESADRTLSAVETCLPLADELSSKAQALSEGWRGSLGVNESVALAGNQGSGVGEFVELAARNSAIMRVNLREIMLAQEFQDLTGQVINRVIDLIQEVEESLVGLIRVSSNKLQGQVAEKAEPQRTAGSECFGPAVPGVDSANSLESQDEVDNLLASLGF